MSRHSWRFSFFQLVVTIDVLKRSSFAIRVISSQADNLKAWSSLWANLDSISELKRQKYRQWQLWTKELSRYFLTLNCWGFGLQTERNYQGYLDRSWAGIQIRFAHTTRRKTQHTSSRPQAAIWSATVNHVRRKHPGQLWAVPHQFL